MDLQSALAVERILMIREIGVRLCSQIGASPFGMP